MSAARPSVVVFAAVRNEERDLRAAVSAVLRQDYPASFVLALAVGPSNDRTVEIAQELAAEDARVVVVDNPTGLTPQGLNIAVAAGISALPTATYLVRTDGHAELPADYLRVAVDVLERTGADNVGGMMIPVGKTPLQRAVASAMSHPIGLGGGRFHVGGLEGPADTVYLGAFRRATFERAGGYDDYWSRAQDWELNLRLRQQGSVVWFTPRLRVDYRPRSSFRLLAKQFFTTGRWRREVIGRYPTSASPRYLAPPTLVVAVALSVVASAALFFAGTSAPWAVVPLVVPGLYLVGVVVGSLIAGRGLDVTARLMLPAALVVMHVCWGAGFLLGRHHARAEDEAATPTGGLRQ